MVFCIFYKEQYINYIKIKRFLINKWHLKRLESSKTSLLTMNIMLYAIILRRDSAYLPTAAVCIDTSSPSPDP